MKWKILSSGLAAGLMLFGPSHNQQENSLQKNQQSTPSVETCDEEPGKDYAQSITGFVDGDLLKVVVSARFAGAVESVTWRGKEFINTWDHGREISYAWGMDGFGECLNPTEPGTANDYQNLTSSSRLIRVCRTGENELTTTAQLAYWLAPGQGGICHGGVARAVNDAVLSDHILEKTIQIGYQGMEHVISFTAVVTLPESYSSNALEIPTGYLTHEFNDYWLYNPISGDLMKPEGQPIHEPPWSFEYFGNFPPILATGDGAYAMGAYSAQPILGYSIFGTNTPNLKDRTHKWNIVRLEQPAPAGSYVYQSFAVVGTLAQVQDAMHELYMLHPVDLEPPTGYIDVANCNEIAGWAWDPKTPDQSIAVDFYALNEDDTETLLTRIEANLHREDLVTALGDTGNHGFHITTSEIVHDNRRVVLRAYAVNSNPNFPGRQLYGSGQPLECPMFSPPLEPTATQAPTVSMTPAADTKPGSTPKLPCPSAALFLAAGFVLWAQRRTR